MAGMGDELLSNVLLEFFDFDDDLHTDLFAIFPTFTGNAKNFRSEQIQKKQRMRTVRK